MTTDDTHIRALHTAQRVAGQEYADRLADLAAAAAELVQIETALRVAETQAGLHDPHPPARELAHDMLCGRLCCLRPYLAFGTAESADRAEECLTTPPPAKARVPPRFVVYEGDPVAFIIASNLERRHLTTSQRAMVAEELANLTHGGDRSKAQKCALSRHEAADLLGVSERSVDSAAELKREAPELAEKVVARAGEQGVHVYVIDRLEDFVALVNHCRRPAHRERTR